MQRLVKAYDNAQNGSDLKKTYLWVVLVICSSAFVRVSENVDFQLSNVLYSPSTRKDPLTFKTSEPIGKIQFTDSIRWII